MCVVCSFEAGNDVARYGFQSEMAIIAFEATYGQITPALRRKMFEEMCDDGLGVNEEAELSFTRLEAAFKRATGGGQ